MSRLTFLATVATLASLVAVGCAEPSDVDATAASDQALVSQPSSDTTVLKVSVEEAINGYGSPGFDPSQCTPTPNGRMDCTRELERRFAAPAMHDVDVGRDMSAGPFFCRVVHVVTATKRGAADASVGMGFYYAGYAGAGRFVPKAGLKPVGSLTLKDGTPAVLHEFIGLANCWLGSASSSMQARYEFKPYVAFEANGERYLNWDATPGNHSVTTRYSVWDRTGDLAQP